MSLLLALAPEKKEVDVSAHIDVATQSLFIAAALIVLFFVLRPELWRRIWFSRLDPRGAALARMALGITVIWTFADLLFLQGEWLFTDQGLFLTEQARKNYGGKLRQLWDPEQGFEHWWDFFIVLSDRFTVLHLRSDPPFVYAMFALLFAVAFLMVIGWRTRITTVLTWFMVLQLYGYTPIYFAGGDTVLRVMMFCAIFTDWGQAYSVDAWRRRRKAVLVHGATQVPALKHIAAWPQRFFMLQLACIYCATGLLKSGPTWADGSALYYALNLDHFYRVPMHYTVAWAHKLYITRVMTVVVHWWEMLFPIAIVGEALRGWDHDVEKGVWTPPVPRWTLYALIVAASVWAIWTQPLWMKTLPLFIVAGLVYVERRWFGPAKPVAKPALIKPGAGPAEFKPAEAKAVETKPVEAKPVEAKPAAATGLQPILAWAIRLGSWACVLGVLIVAAYMVRLGVLYYYAPAKNVSGWLADKELLQTLASATALTIPLVVILGIAAARRWAPKIYLFIRDWLLGKRVWLGIGLLMHIGIDLTMNVGTFVQVMYAVYPIWLWGHNVDSMWRFLLWRAAKPGEADRPALPAKGWRRLLARLAAPYQRIVHRVRPQPWVVVHGPVELGIRRAALLRCWDLGERLDYQLDPGRTGEAIGLRDPEGKLFTGATVGRELISLLPGLWWLWPISVFPGVGRLAMAILRQRG
jgi:hypothetical protein